MSASTIGRLFSYPAGVALSLFLVACGGSDKKVVAPDKNAAAGTPVQTAAGGEVGVVDSAGGSGLTGSAPTFTPTA